MKSPRDADAIFDALDVQHPGADTELHFTNAYELLTATILSAQSTDHGVNLVTPELFKRYPTPVALAKATSEELEPQIHSTGFFRAKSRALIGMAQALVKRHGGAVPADMDALTALPGVGRKTANVVLGHALGVPGLPVDRHVLRVANRIGIAEGDDAEDVEQQLCALLPKERWTRASDCLILHGRRVCKPKPLCAACNVQDFCVYFQTGATSDDRMIEPRTRGRKTSKAAAPAKRKPAKRAKAPVRAKARTRAVERIAGQSKAGAKSARRTAPTPRAKRTSPSAKRRR